MKNRILVISNSSTTDPIIVLAVPSTAQNCLWSYSKTLGITSLDFGPRIRKGHNGTFSFGVSGAVNGFEYDRRDRSATESRNETSVPTRVWEQCSMRTRREFSEGVSYSGGSSPLHSAWHGGEMRWP